MDEVFFKSALRAHDPFLMTDSTLALPVEPTPTSSSKSLRVHQQVQLTLARRARRTMSNGSIHLQRNASKSFDANDVFMPKMTSNGMDFNHSSFSSRRVRKPSRRVDVSPPPTQEGSYCYFNHSTPRYGMYTHPGTHRMGPPPDYSFGCDSYHRYAYSEAPRVGRGHISAATLGRIHQRALRQTSVPPPPPAYANADFQQSGDYGLFWNHNQSADVMLGAVQPDEGFAWLAQVRRGAVQRQLSSPPHLTCMEVDMGRPVEVDAPIQEAQVHDTLITKSENKTPEMTLERAVNMLTLENEEAVICAARHVQNQCFKSADAKKIVYYLRGIEKLLQLLDSDNEEVQCVAAGALRNVVYQSNENKMEVKENDGLATILQTLKSSRDVDTRRELTGLLWNLSSHDLLKERLSTDALSVLTKSVLVPSSGISEGENPKDDLLADAEVFHNATGCLRNLSSAGPDGRKAMRECENLIDSLVYYIRGAIADYKTDDKSTENCVCILHNLSYQIESELPQISPGELRESRQNLAPKPKAVGCFAHRSAKIPEDLERQHPLLEEKANPCGMEWLWSAIAIRMYLSLMARSVRHCTQEAAIGALQNITAGNGEMVDAITFTIVQRENGLQHIKKMLEEGESDVKRTAISLVRNLSRYRELHPNIVKQVLPEVVDMLPNDDSWSDQPAEVTSSLCHILNNLSLSDKQHVRAIVNEGALPKIISISTKDNRYGPTRTSQAASVLLHTMWKHRDLHGAYKKCGYRKADFINARTTKAVNSG
ncbi:plakophilin-2 [Antennarius striatus]|uniref:plakophilin-2 n=1 Tax=Antennarius striatus TaxID=241820 RepID=UPI0035AE7006